jgi:hypothetical protein
MKYFHKINWFNYPYALFISIRSDIYVWKIELPEFLTGRFRRLLPHEKYTSDQWIKLRDDCFVHWRDTVFPIYQKSIKCLVEYQGTTIDFSLNLWQHLGLEFEQFYLFAATVRQYQDKSDGNPEIHIPCILLAVPESVQQNIFPNIEFTTSRLFLWMESLQAWGISWAYYLRSLALFFAALFKQRPRIGSGRFLWLGISPQEIPEHDLQLNCAWAAQYAHLPKDDVLHFLPLKATKKQNDYLTSQGIRFIEPHEFFTLISISNRIRAIVSPLFALWRGALLDKPLVGAYRFRMAADALRWFELVSQLKPEACFTTTSSCWPEHSQIAVMKCLGIRSVIWGYSANNLSFAKLDDQIVDRGVQRSFFIADEYWAWNKAVVNFLDKRRLLVGRTLYKDVGMMMCGDIRHLELLPSQARRMLGLPETGFHVAIFDVPPVNQLWLNKFAGGPPLITYDYAHAFFSGVKILLENFPNLRVMIKLKRKMSDPLRGFPPVLHELVAIDGLWVKEGRVVVLNVNMDPFLPIAASEASLGMAFTSPVLAGLANRRFGAYYDPLKVASFPSEPSLMKLLLQDEHILLETVSSWMNTRSPVSFSSGGGVLMPSMGHHNLLEFINQQAEPPYLKEQLS